MTAPTDVKNSIKDRILMELLNKEYFKAIDGAIDLTWDESRKQAIDDAIDIVLSYGSRNGRMLDDLEKLKEQDGTQ